MNLERSAPLGEAARPRRDASHGSSAKSRGLEMAVSFRSIGALSLLFLAAAGCRSPYYADRGALTGGLIGAGAGALVGEHNGNALAGAVIGSAAGAIAGSAIGEGIDADIARNNAIIEERMGRQLAGAVTTADVVGMSQSGLSGEVIVTHIRANGMAQRPQAGDLIALKNQGVSDRVLNAMQQPPAPRVSQATYAAPPPVIVEEHYYGRPYPPPYWGHRHHHHFHSHHRRPGVSWGFSFSK